MVDEQSPLTCTAVLFDAAGTLLHVTPSVGHVYADGAARHGVHVDPDAINAHFRDEFRRRIAIPDHVSPFHTSEEEEAAWWYALVEAVFESAGARFADGAFDAYFAELHKHFAWPGPWRIYDDVVPTLDALEARGIRKAVLSNWDSRLPLLLDRMGLASRFEFILTSAEVGWRKPDPRIFDAALARLGQPRKRVLHVGDSHEQDVLGAQRAGVTPIHLQRDGRTPSAGRAISSLADLPSQLEGTF